MKDDERCCYCGELADKVYYSTLAASPTGPRMEDGETAGFLKAIGEAEPRHLGEISLQIPTCTKHDENIGQALVQCVGGGHGIPVREESGEPDPFSTEDPAFQYIVDTLTRVLRNVPER